MAAQAGLCLAWSKTPEDSFCRVVAQLHLTIKEQKCEDVLREVSDYGKFSTKHEVCGMKSFFFFFV